MLQVDGYVGYRALAERNAVTLAFCWAHVRRRFFELAAAGPAPNASEALQRIAALYQIETEIRCQGADERRAVRQQKSRPILQDFEPWLRTKLALISQKTKLAEAIRYALSRWEGLSRFIDDGRIEINSNVVERAIRPIALNRKNALFAGSDGGARSGALGRDRFADRDVQTERRRTPRLPRHDHHKDRQWPPQQPPRRTPPVGLSRRERTQRRGLKAALMLGRLHALPRRRPNLPQR